MGVDSNLHIVLLTLGSQGHMNAFTSLARKLASLGVSVTLPLPTSKTLIKSMPKADSLQGLDIRITVLPQVQDDTVVDDNSPSPLSLLPITVKGIRRRRDSSGTSTTFRSAHASASLKKFLKDRLEDPATVSPAVVVHDFFSYWAPEPIDELGIPRYVLSTASTSHLAVGLYLFANPDKKSSEYLKQEAERQGVIRVPGLPTLPWEEVGPEFRVESDHFYLGEKTARESLLGSKGILLSSCHALEGGIITTLQAAHPDKFLPVGPLIMTGMQSTSIDHPCLSWLDKHPSRSVIYVSFGSWAGLDVEQIKELALGLEMSNKLFLWVLPIRAGESTPLEELLPEGFLDRMAGRGLVYPDWVPQVEILAHASVGGFVTHCGWNSVIECSSVGGVPMLGWPFVADQPISCRYLAEVLGVAADVHENSEGVADRDEVCRGLCALEDPGLRERAARLKRRVNEDEDGKTLEEFVKRLKEVQFT